MKKEIMVVIMMVVMTFEIFIKVDKQEMSRG